MHAVHTQVHNHTCPQMYICKAYPYRCEHLYRRVTMCTSTTCIARFQAFTHKQVTGTGPGTCTDTCTHMQAFTLTQVYTSAHTCWCTHTGRIECPQYGGLLGPSANKEGCVRAPETGPAFGSTLTFTVYTPTPTLNPGQVLQALFPGSLQSPKAPTFWWEGQEGPGAPARGSDRGKAGWTRVQLERLPLGPSCLLQTAADRFLRCLLWPLGPWPRGAAFPAPRLWGQ